MSVRDGLVLLILVSCLTTHLPIPTLPPAKSALLQKHKDVAEQLANAEKASSVLAKEQRVALARSLEGFVTALADSGVSPAALEVLTEEGWAKKEDWTREQWEYWQTWGFFRQFARFVRVLPMSVALGFVLFF